MSKPVKILVLVFLIIWAITGTVSTGFQYLNPRVVTEIEKVEVVKWKERKSVDEDTEILETFHPNGAVASRTTRKKTKEIVDSNRDTDSREKDNSLSEPVLPPAPRWNIVANYNPFSGKIEAGGGMNLGGVSVWVQNPVAVEFSPRIGAMLRF